MTSIAIFPEQIGQSSAGFVALGGNCQSFGRTAGEALDAITAQMGENAASTLVVIQHMRGDSFFSEAQRTRLGELMRVWRIARDRGESLSECEQAELQDLINTELIASGRRAAHLADAMKP